MRIPVWVTIGVAILVISFGLIRIRLAFRSDEKELLDKKRKGLYGMGKRTHLLIGIVYLLLGGGLIAASLGWNPLGRSLGPATEEPTNDTAPTKGAIPIDQLPANK
ncbi:MAG: hypothetical protein H6Q90_1609 [Deltaproteobacteria bacterium]|nr:hypothetical protein [Deltaproteobacteria bacterium]